MQADADETMNVNRSVRKGGVPRYAGLMFAACLWLGLAAAATAQMTPKELR